MAEQIGASVSTVRRLEAGDAGVAIQHLLGVMSALGSLDQFNALLDTPQDTIGLLMQDAFLPERAISARNCSPAISPSPVVA